MHMYAIRPALLLNIRPDGPDKEPAEPKIGLQGVQPFYLFKPCIVIDDFSLAMFIEYPFFPESISVRFIFIILDYMEYEYVIIEGGSNRMSFNKISRQGIQTVGKPARQPEYPFHGTIIFFNHGISDRRIVKNPAIDVRYSLEKTNKTYK